MGTEARFAQPGAGACNQTQRGRNTKAQGPAGGCQLKDVALEPEPGQSLTWCFACWSSVFPPFCTARPPELWGWETHASASAGCPAQFSFLQLVSVSFPVQCGEILSMAD